MDLGLEVWFILINDMQVIILMSSIQPFSVVFTTLMYYRVGQVECGHAFQLITSEMLDYCWQKTRPFNS